MQENFLKRFIKEEKYLQNPPLETKKFIDFCKKRGIESNASELEFFEKEGLLHPIIRIDRPIGEEEWIEFKKDDGTFCRPARQGLLEGEEKIRKYKIKYYSDYGFDEFHKELLIDWYKHGNLFDPATKEFQEWSSFKGKELYNGSQKIVSYYSSFQINWIEKLKKECYFKINLASNSWNKIKIKNIDDFILELKRKSDNEYFRDYFNFEKTKETLKHEYENFEKFLEFLLSIQFIYFPYGRSGSKGMTFNGEGYKKWKKNRWKYNPKEELDYLNLDIKYVYKYYCDFSEKASKLLGVKNVNDGMQLWKNINWNKKKNFEGKIRLGIEYLQWTLMLKKFIEDYFEKEIPDIDEIRGYPYSDITKLDFNKIVPSRNSLRAVRFRDYSDPEKNKNYYHNKYKRLYYLSNDFELNYQPRVLVFVEGKTEEEVLPKFFEWFTDKPENRGIQIINLDGINNFFGQELNLKDPQTNKYRKSRLNNFNNLISYNLRKWQIIPFFVGDNENNIKELLKSGISINFSKDTENFILPEKWQYIWNKDFEFDNFTNKELANAISDILDKKVNVEKVKEVRNSDSSINGIDEKVHDNKVEIAKKLHDNLLKCYRNTNNDKILNRPVFKMINRILDLCWYNHPPANTIVEKKNKEIFLDFLEGNIKD